MGKLDKVHSVLCANVEYAVEQMVDDAYSNASRLFDGVEIEHMNDDSWNFIIDGVGRVNMSITTLTEDD